MSRIRRILHPSDFARASAAAFAKDVEVAKTNRAELLPVHVLTPAVPMAGDGHIASTVDEDLEASAKAAAQKQLE
jgi:nucleotide-binding universal stress UspA family protein